MNKQSTLKNNITKLFQFAKTINFVSKFRIQITVFVYALLPASSIVFEVLLLRYIVETYNNFNWREFGVIITLLLLFQIFVWLVESYYVQYYSEQSNTRIIHHLYFEIFKKIECFSLDKIENKDFYDNYYFILQNVEKRVYNYISIIERATSSFIMLFTISTIVILSKPLVLLFILFPIVVEFFLTPYLNKLIIKYEKNQTENLRKGDYVKRIAYLKEFSKEIRTTKIKNVLFSQYAQFISYAKVLIESYGAKIGSLVFFTEFSFQIVSFFGATLYIIYCVFNGNMQISDAVVILSTYNQIIYSFKNIIDIYRECMEEAVHLCNMFEFISNDKSDSKKEINNSVLNLIETIEFKNVSFKYPNEEKLSLSNISFYAKKGEHISICGLNGSGKSTLVKLITGLYKPTEGEIFINGVNINQYYLEDYKKRISTVNQNFVLFATDLEHNIMFKNIENDYEEKIFKDAINKSGFFNKYLDLDKAGKTILTKEFDKDGEIFSGGEMQKIAIARAIANLSEVIVLDEPTSAMDPIAEKMFYEMFFKNFENKINFIVSHNFSMTKCADKILFLSGGKLIENGTHEQLLSLEGEYSKCFKIQANFFKG